MGKSLFCHLIGRGVWINTLEEFEAVTLDKYDQTVWGNIATVYTTMNDFDGPILMFLKKRKDGKYFALLTSENEMTSDTAMPTYTKRWRIEDFFKDNIFLGMDKLPSLNLNAIQTMLSLRLLAFHALDNFRHDLGPRYKSKTPEMIHREFINGVQGRVQLRGNVITVNIYGFEHQVVSKTSTAQRILPMISTSKGHRSTHTSHSVHSDALTDKAEYNLQLNSFSSRRTPWP